MGRPDLFVFQQAGSDDEHGVKLNAGTRRSSSGVNPNSAAVETCGWAVPLRCPFRAARVRGSADWCHRHGVKNFSRYPS